MKGKYRNRFKLHPYVELFPPMPPDQFKTLKEDIRLHGLQTPLIVHSNQLVDGRCRQEACVELGIKAPVTEYSTLLSHYREHGLLQFVISQNLHRRHLTESQRAMVAGKIKKAREAQEAADRKADEKAGKRKAKESAQDFHANLHKNSKRGRPRQATTRARERAAVAASLNVSERLVADAEKVLEEAPEKVAAIEAGEVTVHKAVRDLSDKPRTKVKRPKGGVLLTDKISLLVVKAEEARSKKYSTIVAGCRITAEMLPQSKQPKTRKEKTK